MNFMYHILYRVGPKNLGSFLFPNLELGSFLFFGWPLWWNYKNNMWNHILGDELYNKNREYLLVADFLYYSLEPLCYTKPEMGHSATLEFCIPSNAGVHVKGKAGYSYFYYMVSWTNIREPIIVFVMEEWSAT